MLKEIYGNLGISCDAKATQGLHSSASVDSIGKIELFETE